MCAQNKHIYITCICLICIMYKILIAKLLALASHCCKTAVKHFCARAAMTGGGREGGMEWGGWSWRWSNPGRRGGAWMWALGYIHTPGPSPYRPDSGCAGNSDLCLLYSLLYRADWHLPWSKGRPLLFLCRLGLRLKLSFSWYQ